LDAKAAVIASAKVRASYVASPEVTQATAVASVAEAEKPIAEIMPMVRQSVSKQASSLFFMENNLRR
jgi:hypothetical protein